MPRGKTVRIGSVDSGQSMVRPGHNRQLIVIPKDTGASLGLLPRTKSNGRGDQRPAYHLIDLYTEQIAFLTGLENVSSLIVLRQQMSNASA